MVVQPTLMISLLVEAMSRFLRSVGADPGFAQGKPGSRCDRSRSRSIKLQCRPGRSRHSQKDKGSDNDDQGQRHNRRYPCLQQHSWPEPGGEVGDQLPHRQGTRKAHWGHLSEGYSASPGGEGGRDRRSPREPWTRQVPQPGQKPGPDSPGNPGPGSGRLGDVGVTGYGQFQAPAWCLAPGSRSWKSQAARGFSREGERWRCSRERWRKCDRI